MATNQTGVQIVIKAWLPVTGSISEQIAKLQMVETAHTSGDYSELLKAASVEDIKAEQKTRRIEDAPAAAPQTEYKQGDTAATDESGMSSGGDVEDASGLAERFEAVEPASNDEPAQEPAPRRRKAAAE